MIWALLAAFLFIASQAEATTYFVRKDGNNACNGLADTAGSSGTCAKLTIAAGLALATSPGDIVQVNAGTYAESVTMSTSGTSGNKITLRGHSGTCPTTANTSPHAPSTRPNPNVIVTQTLTMAASNIRLECFRITPPTGTGADGIHLSGSRSNIDIIQNYIDGGTSGQGNSAKMILMDVGAATKNSSVTVDSNYMTRFESGPYIWCDNCTFSNNEIERLLGLTPPANGDNDYHRWWGDSNVFRRNYLHGTILSEISANDPHTDCFQTFNVGNGSTFVATNTVFDGNVCTDAHQGILMRDISCGNPCNGAFQFMFNTTVMNNIWIGGGIGGFGGGYQAMIFDHVGNVSVVNNTFDGGSPDSFAADCRFIANSTGVSRNNIHLNLGFMGFNGVGCQEEDTSSVTYSNNLVYDPARTYDCTGGGSGTLCNVNPQFVNAPSGNYQLQSTSPAINAGTTVAFVTTDKAGTTRPQGAAYDMGAFEFTSGGGPTPPNAPSNLRFVGP